MIPGYNDASWASLPLMSQHHQSKRGSSCLCHLRAMTCAKSKCHSWVGPEQVLARKSGKNALKGRIPGLVLGAAFD